jgi:hypothetical protein
MSDGIPTNGQAKHSTNGRESNGQFVAGNPGGPGNPFARQVAQLRAALLKAVTPADIEAIARTLLEKARAGDVAAARLLLAYLLGKPAAVVNPDTLDLEEVLQRFRCPDLGQLRQALNDRCRPDMAVVFDRLWDVAQKADAYDALKGDKPDLRARRAADLFRRGYFNRRRPPSPNGNGRQPK